MVSGFGKESVGDFVKSSFRGMVGIKSLMSVLNWGRGEEMEVIGIEIILESSDVIRRR